MLGVVVKNGKGEKSAVIASHVRRASRLFDRMKGLLGQDTLRESHGLWIDSCNSIHTFFMRFAIDAVFVNRDGRVVKTYERLLPYRITRVVWEANAVLELPSGAIEAHQIRVGDCLKLENSKGSEGVE